jgi:hypothetical protein
MSKVIFGAYYENDILYVEAFDIDNLLDLNMRFVSQGAADVENPSTEEKQQFRLALNTAINTILPNF